jgi:hypothetical protein
VSWLVPYLETTGVVRVVWVDPVLRQEYRKRDCLQLQEVSTIPFLFFAIPTTPAHYYIS